MGRRKLEMKKIENLQARRVCFTKRRQGLFKKASKLSKDHNVKILSIVFSPSGNPFVFSSGNHPSISFDSMLQNFLLLNGSSSSSPPANDFEHCSTSTTSSVDDEATIDLEEETLVSDSSIQFGEIQHFEIEKNPNLLCTNFDSIGFEEQIPIIDFEHCSTSSYVDDEATIDLEEETLVSTIEGISDSSIQFDEIQHFEIEKNPNFVETGGFEEQTPIIDLEGISDSSFQFCEIQPLSDFDIENPNFVEMDDGFEEQSSSSFLDVEDYYGFEEEIRSPVLVGADEDSYGFTTDLSQIQFGEEYEFDPLLLDSNLLR